MENKGLFSGIKSVIATYLDELLYKVQWPSLEDLQSSTITVLITSFMIAAAIFVMDFAFSRTMTFLYQLVN